MNMLHGPCIKTSNTLDFKTEMDVTVVTTIPSSYQRHLSSAINLVPAIAMKTAEVHGV